MQDDLNFNVQSVDADIEMGGVSATLRQLADQIDAGAKHVAFSAVIVDNELQAKSIYASRCYSDSKQSPISTVTTKFAETMPAMDFYQAFAAAISPRFADDVMCNNPAYMFPDVCINLLVDEAVEVED